jgi:hypothetical protein
MVSCSDFVGGCEEFARLHGRQALQAGRVGCRPARAEEAGLGDAGHGDGVGLVAAQHEEMRIVLADREADVAAGAAGEDQYRAGDGFGVAPEQQPVACPVRIHAQCAEQRFFGQAHANAGLDEVTAPWGFGRIAR